MLIFAVEYPGRTPDHNPQDMARAFKQLYPSLILIAAYFIADELFSPVFSVIFIFLLGVAEFTYTRIREKENDKIVLWTTLFFCFPGILSIYAPGSKIAQLQPAIIESALCLLLGVFAFSRLDLASTLPASYRKNIQLDETQQKAIKKLFKILFFIFCIHNLLAYIALLTFTEASASFITGPLLYIVIGIFFITIFIRNLMLRKKMQKEEWLPLVDEQGEITGQAPRSVCHSGSKLLHPVVHLHIINDKNEIFLQKRSLKKDLLPGLWDIAVGGHIGLNEKVEEALKRETFEELGITNFEARFIGNYVWESPREKELVFSFQCSRYDHIRIDNDEVDEGKFWTAQEIEKGIAQNQLTPNFIHEYQTLLKGVIKEREGHK